MSRFIVLTDRQGDTVLVDTVASLRVEMSGSVSATLLCAQLNVYDTALIALQVYAVQLRKAAMALAREHEALHGVTAATHQVRTLSALGPPEVWKTPGDQ